MEKHVFPGVDAAVEVEPKTTSEGTTTHISGIATTHLHPPLTHCGGGEARIVYMDDEVVDKYPKGRVTTAAAVPPRPPPLPHSPMMGPTRPLYFAKDRLMLSFTFNGQGGVKYKDWNAEESTGMQGHFVWDHVQILRDKTHPQNDPHMLTELLCPPLTLIEILSLTTDGPFCGYIGDMFVFRMNSGGPPGNEFTLRIAGRVSQKGLATVSLGNVPRLDYMDKYVVLNNLWLVPRVVVDSDNNHLCLATTMFTATGTPTVLYYNEDIVTHLHRCMEADYTVARSISNLIVHVMDTHVDLIRDRLAQIAQGLDSIEIQWKRGDYRTGLLNQLKFPELQLNLQCLLQAMALADLVLPQVKSKYKDLSAEDVDAMTEIIRRLESLQKTAETQDGRVKAIHAEQTRKESERINKRLYYLSIISAIFLPLSVITGVFGMNVRGIPWIQQNDPYGFRNVLFVWVACLFLVVPFAIPGVIARIARQMSSCPTPSLPAGVNNYHEV